MRDKLAAQDSLVFRGSYRLVVPVSLRGALINLAHQGHQGIVRTKQRLRDLYWWPGMDHSAQSAITSCQLCQAHEKSAKTHTPPLQPVPLQAAPWQKVGQDIVGPFELGTWDCRYAFTLVDNYSKWPEIAFTSNVTTDTVTDFLATTFSRFGNLVEIVTDNQGWTGTKNRPWHFLVQAAHHHHIIYIYIYIYIYNTNYISKKKSKIQQKQ